jgi:uncharacterized protein YeaO (DUF488 family)
MLPLQVWTARASYRGADRLDITRQFADAERKAGRVSPGEPFAPSWDLLMPVVRERREHASDDATWPAYVEGFRAEMRRSYVRQRAAWTALLGQDEVTLVCLCGNPARCHRGLLGEILEKLGACWGGERREIPRQTSLFDLGGPEEGGERTIRMRAPCGGCGETAGVVKRISGQDTVRCARCARFAYNAPRRETEGARE